METSTILALTAVWPPVDSRMMEMMQDNRTHNHTTTNNNRTLPFNFLSTVNYKFRIK